MRKIMLGTVAGVALLGAVLWGPIMSHVEQAQYTAVEAQGNIEIRDYDSMIVAEAQVSGERSEAINKGFRIIADYIFGNNIRSEKVAMTAPVTQQLSEKIAMTAPVMQTGGEDLWKVRFVMPASHTLQTLPKPNNPAVQSKPLTKRTLYIPRKQFFNILK